MNLQPSALETDALPLSYSPKKLEDLDDLRCGYTSAVTKEADVYPFSWNVARVFRKNSRLALAWVLITGCWTGPATLERAPAAASREISPALPEVRAAEVGTWDDAEGFHPAVDIPLVAGQAFGWRLDLGCTGWVTYQEQLVLPAPGDWPSDPEMQVSLDGRSVTIRSSTICIDGWIEKRWSVAAEDPPGVWTWKVTAQGRAPRTLHVRFAAP